MKKIIIAILFALVTMTGTGMAKAEPMAMPAAIPANSAVFFSPHQDDEVLTMGAAIHEHTQAGRPTYVVLLTDGGASGVCLKKFATRAECTAYRDNEFKNAVRSMGAIPVIPYNRMPDGQTTVSGLQSIMRPYLVNGHSLKTFSWTDDYHKDHLNAGAALRGLGFTDSRYYIRRDYVDRARANGVNVKKHGFHTDGQCMAAVNAYQGFGWLSVRSSFEEARQGLISYYRFPA